MTEDNRIRCGVIGCGQFMTRQHIPTIARSPVLSLQHLAELDVEKAKRVARRYGAVRCTADWRDVVNDAEVDVVVVGVVPALHPQIARAALARGKPVYVEKPLAHTSEECLAIQRMAGDRGVPVAVGFNRRFAPATELLFRAFQSTGPPATVFYRITDDDRVRPPQQRWKLECRLLIEVVHIFDLLTYLLQAEPLEIDARETRFNDATVMIDFDNGSRATILSSPYGSMAQPKEHLEAVLDRGTLEMDDFVELRSYGVAGLPPIERFAGRPYDGCDNRHVEAFAKRGREALLEMRDRYNTAMIESGVLEDSSNDDAWARVKQIMGDPPLPQVNYASDKGWGQALEDFCLAATQGREPRNANAIDGNRATACAVAARQSIQTRRPVTLDPEQWLGAGES